MNPLTVSIDVRQSRDDVFDYLDVLANHEQFTNHMMRNWRLEGPPRGRGARATVDVVFGKRSEPVEIEVIEAQAPERTVERNVGAGGQRVATGTYTLTELPDGGTRVAFQYAWLEAPLGERLLGPFIRRTLRMALVDSLRRLANQLDARGEAPDAAGSPQAGRGLGD